MLNLSNLLIASLGLGAITSVLSLCLWRGQHRLQEKLLRLDLQKEGQHNNQLELQQRLDALSMNLMNQLSQGQQAQAEYRHRLDEHHVKQLTTLQESLQQAMSDVRQQMNATLNHNAQMVAEQLAKLTQGVDNRLKEISGQVDKRLAEGFEKTNATFTDVIKRLALIDQAQQKITELSTNVVSLQEVLSDKRSRGVFGEVQLNALIRNVLPESQFSIQHTLSNGKRVDCLLFFPAPTGHVAIDAKFPLESYQKLVGTTRLSDSERRQCEQQFRQDIRKHLQDISTKYIIPGETADGAMMFIPAEAVFAEIHAHYPDLVEEAHKARVWMASPTTLMAILTTARAVIKDEATRQQVNIIREHLGYLSQDFDRFQKRMDALAKHIDQANTDVKEVQISAQKISTRFNKIEKVEFAHPATALTTEE